MKFLEFLKKEKIFLGYPGEAPKQIDKYPFLKDFTFALFQGEKYTPSQVQIAISAIIEREKAMTTGIGEGIAIPHASLVFLKKPLLGMCIYPTGLEFEAIDQKPVYIILNILIPKEEFTLHIQTLASIARFFHQKNIRKKLIQAKTPEEAYKIIEKAASSSV